MIVQLNWQEKMHFLSTAGQHEVSMDAKAPIGQNLAQTPKELVASALCGCTAMDVIAWLRKHKQTVDQFTVKAEISVKEKGYPAVFEKAHLTFQLTGDIAPAIAEEAVRLSQSKYCAVSAMLAKAFPITWDLLINEQQVASGTANFD